MPVCWPAAKVRRTKGPECDHWRPEELALGAEQQVRVRAGGEQIFLGQAIADVDVWLEDFGRVEVKKFQAAKVVRQPGEVFIEPAELEDEAGL